jgi:hypothetical protein
MAFSQIPEGRVKYVLGREPRREERLIYRMRACVNQVGAFDDMSERGFCLSYPPFSGTTGVAHEPRLSKSNLTHTC